MSKPLQILKTSIESPFNPRVSNVVLFKMLRRSSSDLFFKFGTISIALRCTPLITLINIFLKMRSPGLNFLRNYIVHRYPF